MGSDMQEVIGTAISFNLLSAGRYHAREATSVPGWKEPLFPPQAKDPRIYVITPFPVGLVGVYYLECKVTCESHSTQPRAPYHTWSPTRFCPSWVSMHVRHTPPSPHPKLVKLLGLLTPH